MTASTASRPRRVERDLPPVEALPAAARREEIARMLSGAVVTEEARAAADSLMTAGA